MASSNISKILSTALSTLLCATVCLTYLASGADSGGAEVVERRHASDTQTCGCAWLGNCHPQDKLLWFQSACQYLKCSKMPDGSLSWQEINFCIDADGECRYEGETFPLTIEDQRFSECRCFRWNEGEVINYKCP